MDVGGLIVNFFKEGFGRFFNNFPTVDVPNPSFTGDVIPKTIAGIFPFLDKDKDGKVKKIPNLSILFNPFAMITELIPHAAKSFFPAIFGAGGTAFGAFAGEEFQSNNGVAIGYAAGNSSQGNKLMNT